MYGQQYGQGYGFDQQQPFGQPAPPAFGMPEAAPVSGAVEPAPEDYLGGGNEAEAAPAAAQEEAPPPPPPAPEGAASEPKGEWKCRGSLGACLPQRRQGWPACNTATLPWAAQPSPAHAGKLTRSCHTPPLPAAASEAPPAAEQEAPPAAAAAAPVAEEQVLGPEQEDDLLEELLASEPEGELEAVPPTQDTQEAPAAEEEAPGVAEPGGCWRRGGGSCWAASSRAAVGTFASFLS
jgi:hypothetical protein